MSTEADTPQPDTGPTLPKWDVRADYANAVLRVGKARERVAETRAAYNSETHRLAILEEQESKTLASLLAACGEGAS